MTVDQASAEIYQFSMAANKPSVTEEAGAVPVIADTAGAEVKEAARGFLKAARKDLTQEEAASPAGLRWLQYEAERLDQECGATRREMRDLRQAYDALITQYTEARIAIEKLGGAKRVSVRNEILSTLCIGAGGAGLGVTPGYFTIADAADLAHVGLVISAVLFIGGITVRMWK